ncbi:MAG: hypothetical protein EZS28_047497, partial [Streblomastix strix]
QQSTGDICHKGDLTHGSFEFKDGQLITLELNMDAGTLHFFIDDILQPVYVRGINEPVKFYFWIYFKDSSFEIESVKKLTSPTAKVLPNEKAMQL